MALRRAKQQTVDSSEPSISPQKRRPVKDSSAPMPAATGIDDDEIERPPPVGLARNQQRGANRKMTFGTGSQLKNPKGLSIDIDDIADVDEKNTDKNPLNRSQTSGIAANKTPRSTAMLSTRAKTGSNLDSGSASHKETPIPTKHKK